MAHLENLDVLIIGAGISGIGAAYYLQREHPGRSYAILEARGAIGGTWDLFRYPGIRSDSDLHTYGYEFKPWRDEHAIASADKILAYLRETVSENCIDHHIRFHHKALAAAWDSARALWVVDIERTTGDGADPELVQISARWLFCGGGYYRYDQGYSPRFTGAERFTGQIVHPQHWPENLDYVGKKIVVIGSGATAVTLVPALAGKASHVTMLQRSPTYMMPIPAKDKFANVAKGLLGDKRGYALARRKNIFKQRGVYAFCQKYPKVARAVIRWFNARRLPGGYPVDEHFGPRYNPWDQRLCAVPDGDLFAALSDGSASVVTERIATFTEAGIQLESGRQLDAEIIVTATGLNIQLLGGMTLSVDGQPVDLPQTVAYKGMMLSGVPNFVFAFGYTNSSWTLKIDLLCEHFCRVLKHMDDHGYNEVRPVADADMETLPLLDFSAGYVQRSLSDMPRRGINGPWVMSMNYNDDVAILRNGPVVDPNLMFEKVVTKTPSAAAVSPSPTAD